MDEKSEVAELLKRGKYKDCINMKTEIMMIKAK